MWKLLRPAVLPAAKILSVLTADFGWLVAGHMPSLYSTWPSVKIQNIHEHTSIKGYFRVTKWFELEQTFTEIKSYPSVFTRLLKALSSLTLKVSRDGTFVASSGKPPCKEFLSYIQSKSILFQFKTVVPCPVTAGFGKKPFSTFLNLSLLKGHNPPG